MYESTKVRLQMPNATQSRGPRAESRDKRKERTKVRLQMPNNTSLESWQAGRLARSSAQRRTKVREHLSTNFRISDLTSINAEHPKGTRMRNTPCWEARTLEGWEGLFSEPLLSRDTRLPEQPGEEPHTKVAFMGVRDDNGHIATPHLGMPALA